MYLVFTLCVKFATAGCDGKSFVELLPFGEGPSCCSCGPTMHSKAMPRFARIHVLMTKAVARSVTI